MGHPIVGDTLYGAPHLIRPAGSSSKGDAEESMELERNFLHAARLIFTHPRTAKGMEMNAPLPEELHRFLGALRAGSAPVE